MNNHSNSTSRGSDDLLTLGPDFLLCPMYAGVMPVACIYQCAS